MSRLKRKFQPRCVIMVHHIPCFNFVYNLQCFHRFFLEVKKNIKKVLVLNVVKFRKISLFLLI